MTEPTTIALTAGQQALFQSFEAKKRAAEQAIAEAAAGVNGAASAIVLSAFGLDAVQGAQMHVGATAITFTPNPPAAPALVE